MEYKLDEIPASAQDLENTARSPELLEQQLKYCSALLNRLKRNSNAGPFLRPVDPIALGIPDYPDKIKNPMDMSTVRHRLDTRAYRTPEEFNSDMELIFENCFVYNHPESVVYGMGKDLQRAYEAAYAEMPQGMKRRKTEAVSPAKVRRSVRSPEGMNPEDYAFCMDVLNELEKPKHRKCSWPFMQPVTEEDAPGYFSVIASPMDVSTIRAKLEGMKYAEAGEFEADLRLVISNCFQFNKPDTEVYRCGEEFQKVISVQLARGRGVDAQIAELRKKISALQQELRALVEKGGRGTYTLVERERVGKAITQLSQVQVEQVARIVHKFCAYEYVDNDEIEINLETMPDEVVGEIDEYLQKVKSGEELSSVSE